jgi:hypothetical protein
MSIDKTPLRNELLRNMMEYLVTLADNDTDLSTKDVSRINDDLDYLEVKYFGTAPDGDKQNEFALEKPEFIGFEDAFHLLSVRITNSII